MKQTAKVLISFAVVVVSSLAAYYWCDKDADVRTFLKLTVLFLPAIAGFLALFTDLKKHGHLTNWGYAAVLLGFETAALGCVVQLVEQARQAESTAQSIDRQTNMIGSIRELLSPISDEIKTDLFFTIPTDQDNLQGWALQLEKQVRGRARYIELSRISSARPAERQLAQFLDEDFLLFYCKQESCMDSYPLARNRESQLDLAGTVENRLILQPLWRNEVPHYISFNLGDALEVSYDRVTKEFTVAFRSRSQKFDDMSRRTRSADDLSGLFLFVSAGLDPPRHSLSSLNIWRQNGRSLTVKRFHERVIPNRSCPTCESYKFWCGRLPEQWQP